MSVRENRLFRRISEAKIIKTAKKEIYMNKRYFAAANTAEGFHSLFSEVFSPNSLSRIYVIKGGPGTGKSTFMYGIGARAEALGYDTEYYYCSADTGSLDGVKIPALGVALLDGTPPHTVEPRYPGVCETVVDLAANFRTEALLTHGAEIKLFADECLLCYKRSVRFLSAAGEAEKARLDTTRKAFELEKAEKAVRRLLSRAKPQGGGCEERYVSALGTHGAAHIKNTRIKCENTVYISGKYGAETLFLGVVYEQARALGYTLMRHPDVLLRESTEGLYIKEMKTFFSIRDEGDGKINAMRFVSDAVLAENRAKLRFAEKCRDMLIAGALSELAEMGKKHDALEKFYVSAMDFEKSDAMRAQVEKEIFCERK
jgi:hypothetical protein